MLCIGARDNRRERLSAVPVVLRSDDGESRPVLATRSCRMGRQKTAVIDQDELQKLRDESCLESEREKRLDDQYKAIIAEAKKCVGHGRQTGSFPEEWDAQLLVDCGVSSLGHRIVMFCPRFLKPISDNADELDRAFRFILHQMDVIAMRQKYVFIYCCLDGDWDAPYILERANVASEVLPRQYKKHLRCLYILHPSMGLQVSLWTIWAWVSAGLWSKIQYVDSLDKLCEDLFPNNDASQCELRRRFPQIVQSRDAIMMGDSAFVAFGVGLRRLCDSFGVDFKDKTTGRRYPKLPPTIIFLCEALERQAADEDFARIFDADASTCFNLIDDIDKGQPLPQDPVPEVLWCTLKLFLDCLPSPLLSLEALPELQKQDIKAGDVERQRKFLLNLFREQLDEDIAYVALYIASFLNTMCSLAQEREAGAQIETHAALTTASASKVFASCFLRPRTLSPEAAATIPAGESLIETLIQNIHEPELWIGRADLPDNEPTAHASDSEESVDATASIEKHDPDPWLKQ